MVDLRPATASDDELLRRLHASVRADDFAHLELTTTQRATLLQMQLTAERRGHAQEFPRAVTWIVLRQGVPVGTFHVDLSGAAIRIVDIALLPEHRGLGIGAFLIGKLLSEALATRRPVRLRVARGNAAQRLYERLGFTRTGGSDLHDAMEWTPDAR